MECGGNYFGILSITTDFASGRGRLGARQKRSHGKQFVLSGGVGVFVHKLIKEKDFQKKETLNLLLACEHKKAG